jgi:hypothetical protein
MLNLDPLPDVDFFRDPVRLAFGEVWGVDVADTEISSTFPLSTSD